MLKKIKNFGKKPITWGAYGKLCLISYVISLIIMFAMYIYYGLIKVPNIFKKKTEEEPEEDY